MNYAWEPRWLLENIERFHFTSPTTHFQWWYFDVLLNDGSLLVVALVPRGWWSSEFDSDTSRCTLFVSLRSPGETITKRTLSRPSSELRSWDGHLSLGEKFMLEKRTDEYFVSVKLDGISLDMRVHNSRQPFAASPFGRMPHWLVRALSLKQPPISYVTLVPRDHAQVKITTKDAVLEHDGIAYHEQGRFNGTSHDLPRDGWIWFHIFGKEWGVFGAENAYVHISGPETLLQLGFPMNNEVFTLTNKRFWHRDERVVQDVVLNLKTQDTVLTATFKSPDEENLIHYSASNTVELWSTRYANALVHIEHAGKTYDFTAPALLETCRSK
jgi:hypothetical protein